jgi:AraC-like DNA-binding protein
VRRPLTSDGYREHAPPVVLARHVDQLWTRGSADPNDARRVLPDGCVDILFHLGDAPRAEVVGTMTTALVVPPASTQTIVAVRMRPGAAATVLRQPIDELTDRRIELATWWRDWPALHEALVRARDRRAQVELLADRLCIALADAPVIDREVEHAVRRLSAEAPPSIAELARELGRSRQFLARRFTAAVGVGPKVFARVARLARLVRSLSRRGATDWAGLAARHGFFDQAHLVHDFAALVGCTPGQYAADTISPIRAAAPAVALLA